MQEEEPSVPEPCELQISFLTNCNGMHFQRVIRNNACIIAVNSYNTFASLASKSINRSHF